MAADFNAGSIEGTLDLDTAPFSAGLRRAKAQARDFENKRIAPKADLETGEFEAKKKTVQVSLDRLGYEKVKPKADLDISEALAKATILHRALDVGGLGKATVSPTMMLGKFTVLAGGVMSLAAALGPLTAAAVGFGGAATAAFAGAGIALGLFTKAVEGDFKKIADANKKGLALTGPAGQAQKALKSLSGAWDALLKKTSKPVFGDMTKAFTGAAGILPKLAPLLRTTAVGVGHVIDKVVALTKTPLFERFLKSLQQFTKGFLNGLGPMLVSFLRTFMNVFIALQPVMHLLGVGLRDVAHWAQTASANLAHGGIHSFVQYLHEWLPKIGGLFHGLFSALGSLGRAIAPLAGPTIAFLTTLLNTIGRINFAPFTKGFADILTATRPLLPVLGSLVNTVLKPFGELLSSLAHNVITPLAHSLGSELQPAFHDLGTILGSLVQPLSDFLGSIANLVNPTGVSFLTQLLHLLVPVVQELAGPFSHLAVALESVIDTGLKAITPLLPKMSGPMNAAADAAGALANGLADILSHKGVALTLLAIAGGIKAVQVAMAIAKGVTAAYDAVMGTYIALTYGAEGATYASGAALAAYTVITKAASAATKIWAGAQWLLNAAMEANPIILVTTLIAGLVVGLIYAYKHSDIFRSHITGAFHDIGAAAKFMWNDVIRPVFKFIVDAWLTVVGALINGAAKAFGWVPFLGPKLKAAAANFNDFANRVNASLDGIHDKQVTVTANFLMRGSPTVAAMMKNPSLAKQPADVSLNMGAPHRAHGGPVEPDKGYVVGEHGPEWFQPKTAGTILPNHLTMRRLHEAKAAVSDSSDKVVALLTAIANHLAAKDDKADLVDAIGSALSKHSDATMRSMVQIARAK